MRCLSLVGLALILAGCASARPPAPDASAAPGDRAVEPDYARPAVRDARDIEDRLDLVIDRWLGTPYRLGGTGRDGIDCSAFVQTVFADALAVTLPRTTEAQVDVGARVDAEALTPGDLVFFRPDGRTRHVGIFLGDGLFAHASTSEGVTRSRLDAPYWRRAYWTSRRVLPARSEVAVRPAERTSVPAPARESARPAEKRRVGW